jgi:general stress protein 26
MTKSITDLSKEMRDIDFAMLFTQSPDDEIAGRPMSNNGEVDYDGDAYFFAYDTSRSVLHIAQNASVSLSYQGKGGLLGKPPIFISVIGQGELIRDNAQFAEHWSKDLDRWFKEGIETQGLIMIKVKATRVHYWDGYDDGEISL